MSEKKENPKREYLRKLSRLAREMREADPELEDMTINDIVIEQFYTKDGHTEFALFNDWRQRGYKIKKGSKAFVIWGRKRKAQKAAEEPEKDPDEFKFFPLAYLFSNKQVEPLPKEKSPA